MKNKVLTCIKNTTDSNIKFEENGKKVIFINQKRLEYKKVQVDGCTIIDDARCDWLLLSNDEHEERYVELKGVNVKHAIEQLEKSINSLGEYDDNRHSYVICTNVAPQLTTNIQFKKLYFKKRYNSDLIIKNNQLTVNIN